MPENKTKKTKLPEEMRPLFWDVDFDKLYWDDYKEFIASRILTFGNNFSLRFLADKVSKDFMLNLIDTHREIDDLTRNYWKVMYSE